MDEPAGADVEANVTDAVEEDEVAGAQGPSADRAPAVELPERVVRQRDAEVREHVSREATAIEAARRAHAAPGVGHAHEPARVAGDARTLVDDARDCSRDARLVSDAVRCETNAASRVMHMRVLGVDVFALRSVSLMVGGGGQRDARDHTDEQHEQQQLVFAA